MKTIEGVILDEDTKIDIDEKSNYYFIDIFQNSLTGISICFGKTGEFVRIRALPLIYSLWEAPLFLSVLQVRSVQEVRRRELIEVRFPNVIDIKFFPSNRSDIIRMEINTCELDSVIEVDVPKNTKFVLYDTEIVLGKSYQEKILFCYSDRILLNLDNGFDKYLHSLIISLDAE